MTPVTPATTAPSTPRPSTARPLTTRPGMRPGTTPGTPPAPRRPSASRTSTPRPSTPSGPAGTALVAGDVSVDVGGHRLLRRLSIAFEPGELVAVVGASGAGKTTLLETLAGLRPPTAGTVRLGATDVAHAAARAAIGVVPQDDIIHRDLPLRRTLRHAARLRAPRGTSPGALDRLVDGVLADLELAHRAQVRVRDLSGGQRKRASIAVELLTRPAVLFLDEPTSGLDPATAAEVVGVLRRLARAGTTVVFTTHAPADVEPCDRVVALAPGGRLAFDGRPQDAMRWFGIARLHQLHGALVATDPDELAERFAVAVPRPAADGPAVVAPRPGGGRAGMSGRGPAGRPQRSEPGIVRQLAVLTRRNAELLSGNRLTLAILVGSPALVTGMLVLLFRPGGFAPGAPSPVAAVQAVYWIAFAGFFFGLTYGLLQIVTESAVFRRERFWGVSVGAYVASKVVVLLPLLLAVDVVLLGVLQVTDRLPATDAATSAGLAGAFLLDAAAGLALGLLASAAVGNAAQATLALPMLCFPQVLFAGAMVPVPVMTAGGRAISEAMGNRWAFEALGRLLDLEGRFGATLGEWAPAFVGSSVSALAGLGAMIAVTLVATVGVLRLRTRR